MQRENLNLRIRISAMSALIISFCVLTMLALNESITVFENGVYTLLAGYINPTLTSVTIAVTNMGSFLVVAAIVAALLALPFTRISFGIPVAAGAGIAAGLNIVLKTVISRDRPDILRLVTETGYGFPSGHAMNNAALYTMIILIVFRLTKSNKIRIPVLIGGIAITFLIGVSRIYLGVHHTGDVLAGWIMGITIALFTDTVWRLIQSRGLKIGMNKRK